jgi:hypothetical protein
MEVAITPQVHVSVTMVISVAIVHQPIAIPRVLRMEVVTIMANVSVMMVNIPFRSIPFY